MTAGATKPRRQSCRASGCHEAVGAGQAFCHDHWHALPRRCRRALYGRVSANHSEQVEQRIIAAAATLEKGAGA